MATNVQNKITPDWYVPEEEKDKADAARYRIRPLDGMEYLEVVPHMFVDADGYIRYDGKAMQILIRYGLEGWENHCDPETGKELEFSRDAVRRLPPLRLKMLAQEIANRSQLTEGERKN